MHNYDIIIKSIKMGCASSKNRSEQHHFPTEEERAARRLELDTQFQQKVSTVQAEIVPGETPMDTISRLNRTSL
jgi:hypothetical protein